jgi:dihydrofolate reductase
MRKVIYWMSLSLDGFIEAPDGDLSWAYPDEELHRHFNEQEALIDLHLYGRGLYQNMSSYWPAVSDDPAAPQVDRDYARLWKDMPKLVFSTRLTEVGWNSRLVKGDINAEVNRLKAQPGGDISVGGAGLARSFMQLGLIDEYRLYLHPVILGGGKPIFGPLQDKIALQLVATHIFGSGVVQLIYQKT